MVAVESGTNWFGFLLDVDNQMGFHPIHSLHYAFISNASFTLICVSVDTCPLNKLMSGIYTRDWIGIFYSDWLCHIWNR